jgi:hypothetical protein
MRIVAEKIHTWYDISEYVSISKIENVDYDIINDTDVRAKIYTHLCKCIPSIQYDDMFYTNEMDSYLIRKYQYPDRIEFMFYSAISNYFYTELRYVKRDIVNILTGYLKSTFDLEFDEIW